MVFPRSWSRVANFAGGIPDRLMTRIPDFMLDRNASSRAQYLDRLAYYASERWDGAPERFLTECTLPAPSRVERIAVVPFHDHTREVLRFPSEYVPRHPSLRTAFVNEPANQNAYVQLFHHGRTGEPPRAERPLVLCVHGFAMGAPARAIRMFRVQRLLNLGVDVALFTLPCHWRRNPHHPGPEQMLRPQDVPHTIELLGQAVHDLQRAIQWLSARGYDRIGLIGASLGGYVSALLSSLPTPLAFIFLVVPAIDLQSFLRPRRSLFTFRVDDTLRAATHDALQRVAPLAQPAVFDSERMCVVAHQGDRICPVAPTREFVEQRGIRNYVEVVGGHWLYLDRDARGRTWYGWLAQHGFIARQ